MFKLNDQVALVTGGANGIGKGIAQALAQAGAKVSIGDIDADNGRKTAAELGGEFHVLDVTDRKRCQEVVAEVARRHGKLDILCSNTGIFPQASLDEMTEADWDLMQNINLKGMFFIVQAALKEMQRAKYGRVILTSSITGPITGYPGWAHYGASKAGQLGFMRSAALEYARHGITINAVQPGNILTDGLKAQGQDYLDNMRKIIPTHELGEPLDIGYAVAFLASREARFITGQGLVIDGGQILPEEPAAIP